MSKISWLLSSTALIGIAGGSAAIAADVDPGATTAGGSKPAVSDLNAKFDLRGGIQDDIEFYGGVGSVAVPIGHPFGLQVDGFVGALDDDFAVGGAAHLFWRNPDMMMIGAYGEVSHAEAAGAGTLERGALEAEVYLDRVIASGLFGYQAGDLGEGFFSKESLAFYPVEDLRLYVSHSYLPGDVGHAGAVGAEWLTPVANHGLALFAEGGIQEDGDWSAQGGVRLYFGPQKSLLRRHREDDPTDYFGLFVQAANMAIASQPGTTTSPPGEEVIE